MDSATEQTKASATVWRDKLIWFFVGVCAVVPLLGAIWCVDVIPTHDGPKNLYAAHVRSHLDDPAFAAAFKAGKPMTAFGFAWLYDFFEKFVRWQTANALAWTFVIFCSAAGYFLFARSLHPRRWPLGIVGFGAAFSWSVFMGFPNYIASVGLGLATLAVGVGHPRCSWRREAALAALLLGTCVFHPLGAQVAGLGLLISRLFSRQEGESIRQIGVLFLIGSPAIAITLGSALTIAELASLGVLSEREVRHSVLESLENMGILFLSGPSWRTWPLVAVAVGGFVYAFRGLFRRQLEKPDIVVLILGLLMFGAAMVTPFHSTLWHFFSPRFVPLAVLLGIALCPIERLGSRAYVGVISAACLFNVASNAWVRSYNMHWRASVADAFSGFGAAVPPPHHGRPARTLVPIIARPDVDNGREALVPYSSPLRNLGELYGIDRDAVVPYSFSNVKSQHVILQKAASLMPRKLPNKREYGRFFAPGIDPAEHRRELVDLAGFGPQFTDLLFVGSAEDAEAVLQLGYEPEMRQGGFFIGHFVPCRASVHIKNASAAPTLIVGWANSDKPVWGGRWTGPLTEPIPIPSVACAGIWVRVEAKDALCAGSNAKGAIDIPTSRATAPVVECNLEIRAH